MPDHLDGPGRTTLEVDVAEDPSRFVANGDHTLEEPQDVAGLPAYGDYCVTEGCIYPSGTLGRDDPGVECALDGGMPTECTPLYDPIGQWTCYGVFVGDGAATSDGAWVITTQVFEFVPPQHHRIRPTTCHRPLDDDDVSVAAQMHGHERVQVERARDDGATDAEVQHVGTPHAPHRPWMRVTRPAGDHPVRSRVLELGPRPTTSPA